MNNIVKCKICGAYYMLRDMYVGPQDVCPACRNEPSGALGSLPRRRGLVRTLGDGDISEAPMAETTPKGVVAIITMDGCEMATAREKPVDYTKLDGHFLLSALGDDASKWATAFIQHAERLLDTTTPDPFDLLRDHNWLTGWFANAIEHSSDVRRWKQNESSACIHSQANATETINEHWPVAAWRGEEIELAACPQCGGEGDYDARADVVTCQGCGWNRRGPTPDDGPTSAGAIK
jgi:hypothetical protein